VDPQFIKGCNQVRTECGRVEQVVQDREVHRQNLVNIGLALPSLFALLNSFSKFILSQVRNHKFNPKVPIVPGVIYGVPGHDDPHTVAVGPMGRTEFGSVFPTHESGQRTRDIEPIWKPATRNVTRVPFESPMGPAILVVVWVVDRARLDPTRPPTERRLALCTEHLVAPVNLEYHSGAFGTVPGIFGEENGRGDAIWVARMRRITLGTLDLVTIRTGP